MEAQGQQEKAVLSGTAKAKEEQESDENPPSADNTWNASNTQEQNRRPSVFDVFDGLQANRPSADLSYSPSSLESESRAKRQTVETVNDPSVRNGVVLQQEKTPPRVPNPVHNRNVSWGQNDIFTDGLPPLPRLRKPSQDFYGFQNLQQPDLNSNLQSNEFSIANIDIRRRLNSVGNKLDLEDVTQRNPLESEAETYILKVLESRDPTTSRPRSDSEANTTVLSEVPDEALQALVDDAEVDAPSQEDPSALSPRASLESSGATKSTKVLATAKLNRHRRTETMEQKLFGLTTAIGAINSLHNDAYHFVGNTPISPTVYKESTDPLLSSVTEEPTSSGDMFGKNASILYRRANAPKKEDNAVQSIGDANIANEDSSLGTATSRWRLLKQAIHGDTIANPKKNDEERVGEEADEEVGIQSDGETGEENKKLDDRGSNPTGVAADGEEEDTEEEAHVANAIKRDWEIFKEFQDFFSPRRNSIKQYLRSLILYFLLPTISVAAILFHLAGNPPTGIVSSDLPFLNGTLASRDGESINPDKASASWWLLFVCRQAITFSLAKGMELFIVDFLSVRTKATIRLLGPWATLFILQSRGWPFVLFMWGVFNFSMLSGARPFFSHWLYWQDLFDLFNESNPGGNVVDSEWNHRLLAIAVSVSAVVSVKRFWLGLYLGRQTFTRYSDKLASVMKKILLVSEVASLGRDFEKYVLGHTKGSTRAPPSASMFGISGDKLTGFLNSMNDDSSSIGSNSRFRSERSYGTDLNDPDLVIDPEDRHPLTGSLSAGQKTKIIQLLGAWEEPTIAEQSAGRVSVNALLQFRRALACLRTHYPFSGSFGLADTRELCIESAQEVYTRLLLRTPDNSTLTFEILALLSVQRDGTLDHHKIKDLIRLFRPDRDGTLKVLDFVKSVDSVYKELRLLRASVANSSKIDQAFENIFNIVFYAIVITVLLSQLGFDPLALFLSISGVVLGFAFMISTASSKYFEGLLFILVRRPYEIGDGIHVSNIETDTSFTGSAWWTVEDVTLFTTSVVFMFTGERATLSNGSLANSRVINSSRSPEAYLYILLKFPMGVSYDHLQIFNKALEQFFRNRPREWLSYVSFRATRVEADANFVEYIVVGQHRASWADWTALMLSKADLMHFSLELSKKLNIWYRSPPLPVDLSVVSQGGGLNLPGSSPSGPMPSVPNVSAPNTSPGSAINANGNLPDLTGLQDMFAPRKVERS